MATAVYPSMSASAQDSLQALLVKAAYWAESAAGAGPFPMGFYTNMSAGPGDSLQVLAAKLAYWLEQVSGGGGGGGGLAFSTGTGSPEGVITGSPGDTFWDTASDFEYTKITGTATNTGWRVH